MRLHKDAGRIPERKQRVEEVSLICLIGNAIIDVIINGNAKSILATMFRYSGSLWNRLPERKRFRFLTRVLVICTSVHYLLQRSARNKETMSLRSVSLLLVLLFIGSRFHGPSAANAESSVSFIDGFVRLDGERITGSASKVDTRWQ